MCLTRSTKTCRYACPPKYGSPSRANGDEYASASDGNESLARHAVTCASRLAVTNSTSAHAASLTFDCAETTRLDPPSFEVRTPPGAHAGNGTTPHFPAASAALHVRRNPPIQTTPKYVATDPSVKLLYHAGD